MSNVRRTYKLFVGNLPWTIGQKELELYFSKFGHVSSAAIVYDNQQGISKGYGFVTFSSGDGYNSACNQNLHHLEGRVLSVKEASNQ
uniref:RRM domain-containing protein n=1 Tax=Glossina morsitans morsitans TaxID=37546 RepID=A0A905AWJ0_GLOMM